MTAPSREELLASLKRIEEGITELQRDNTGMRKALERCVELFGEIRGDWTDPRVQCREGMETARACLDRVVKSAGSR